MSFRISGQKMKMLSKTKELGRFQIKTFKHHLDTIKSKLTMANYLLSKIMHYVKQYYLKQYTLRFLICISNKGVKSEERIKFTLLKTLKKKKKKKNKSPKFQMLTCTDK